VRLDPFRHLLVTLRPRRAWDLRVGDVAHEDVTEHVLKLAFHRRSPLTTHELLALERLEHDVDRGCVAVRGERSGPEDFSKHRGVLQELLLCARQGVEPCRDEALNRVGKLDRPRVGQPSTLLQHPREFLGVQWVTACPGQDGRLDRRRQDRPLENHVNELGRLRFGERGERQRRRICLAAAPVRTACE
jgi:hypothetical protein